MHTNTHFKHFNKANQFTHLSCWQTMQPSQMTVEASTRSNLLHFCDHQTSDTSVIFPRQPIYFKFFPEADNLSYHFSPTSIKDFIGSMCALVFSFWWRNKHLNRERGIHEKMHSSSFLNLSFVESIFVRACTVFMALYDWRGLAFQIPLTCILYVYGRTYVHMILYL